MAASRNDMVVIWAFLVNFVIVSDRRERGNLIANASSASTATRLLRRRTWPPPRNDMVGYWGVCAGRGAPGCPFIRLQALRTGRYPFLSLTRIDADKFYKLCNQCGAWLVFAVSI